MLDYPSEPNLTTGSLSGIGERQRVRTEQYVTIEGSIQREV